MATSVRTTSTSKQAMLKITAHKTDAQTILVLEGQLADPWVGELERCWRELQMSIPARSVVVDLRDVTGFSERGQDVLFQMMTAGVEVRCHRGVLTRQVLQQLECRHKAQSRKANTHS